MRPSTSLFRPLTLADVRCLSAKVGSLGKLWCHDAPRREVVHVELEPLTPHSLTRKMPVELYFHEARIFAFEDIDLLNRKRENAAKVFESVPDVPRFADLEPAEFPISE